VLKNTGKFYGPLNIIRVHSKDFKVSLKIIKSLENDHRQRGWFSISRKNYVITTLKILSLYKEFLMSSIQFTAFLKKNNIKNKSETKLII